MNQIATIVLALGTLGLVGQNLQAGLATPAGIFNKGIVAGSTQYIGTPFVRTEVSTGVIASVNGTDITVTPTGGDTTYTLNEYSGYTGAATANDPYILEILDGDMIGYIGFITSSGATSSGNAVIRVDVAPGVVAAGTRYAIRPDWTVQTLFGAAATSQIKGTLNKRQASSTADQIQLIGNNGRVATTIYRKWNLTSDAPSQTGNSFIWTSTSTSGDAGKIRLPYSSGIILKAVAGSNYNLTFSGDLRLARLRKEILGYPRYNFVANTSPQDVPLSKTGIQIGRGADASVADTLGILNVTAGTLSQYYLDNNGAWRDADDNLADSVIIPKGTAVVIQRASGNTSALSGDSAVKLRHWATVY